MNEAGDEQGLVGVWRHLPDIQSIEIVVPYWRKLRGYPDPTFNILHFEDVLMPDGPGGRGSIPVWDGPGGGFTVIPPGNEGDLFVIPVTSEELLVVGTRYWRLQNRAWTDLGAAPASLTSTYLRYPGDAHHITTANYYVSVTQGSSWASIAVPTELSGLGSGLSLIFLQVERSTSGRIWGIFEDAGAGQYHAYSGNGGTSWTGLTAASNAVFEGIATLIRNELLVWRSTTGGAGTQNVVRLDVAMNNSVSHNQDQVTVAFNPTDIKAEWVYGGHAIAIVAQRDNAGTQEFYGLRYEGINQSTGAGTFTSETLLHSIVGAAHLTQIFSDGASLLFLAFGGDEAGLLRSIDGGVTWEALAPFLSVAGGRECIAMDYHTATRTLFCLYADDATATSRIFKVREAPFVAAGAWVATATELPNVPNSLSGVNLANIVNMVVLEAPLTPQYVAYAIRITGARTELWKFVNLAWTMVTVITDGDTALPAFVSLTSDYGAAVDQDDDSVAYTTFDGGVSWQTIAPPASNTFFGPTGADSFGRMHFALNGATDTIRYSDDYGTTYTSVHTLPSSTARQFRVSEFNDSLVAIAYRVTVTARVSVSTDRGVTYTDRTVATEAATVSQVDCVWLSTGRLVMTWLVSNVVKTSYSDDSGATWSAAVSVHTATSPEVNILAPGFVNIDDVLFLLHGASTAGGAGHSGVFYRSDDEAVSWDQLNLPVSTGAGPRALSQGRSSTAGLMTVLDSPGTPYLLTNATLVAQGSESWTAYALSDVTELITRKYAA